MAKPPAVKGSTAIVSWADKLANLAQEAAKEEKVASGTAVTCRSGQLSIGGQPVAGNKLAVVVVGSIFENNYYDPDFDYDPEAPRSPICFAFSKKEEGLAPHADSSAPQHEACKGCDFNEFGSALKGRGKACKNIRRLALMSAQPLTADGVKDGEIAYMKLPVTSGPGWAAYVNQLSAVHKRPPFAVITEIGAVPDPKTQFKITFKFLGLIEDDEILGVLEERHNASYDFLAMPYQANAETEAPKKKPVGKKKF